MDSREVMLRSRGNTPRVHGNGFLQLDLEPGVRLHVWGHRNLPRQIVDTGIHDHRFGFTSKVIVGRVVNVSWHTTGYEHCVPETHKVYSPHGHSDKSENTILRDTGHRVAAWIARSETVLRGQSYIVDPTWFHETITDRPSATIMTKYGDVPDHVARVLVPLDKEPDNDFNRDAFPVARLWEIIEEVLSS